MKNLRPSSIYILKFHKWKVIHVINIIINEFQSECCKAPFATNIGGSKSMEQNPSRAATVLAVKFLAFYDTFITTGTWYNPCRVRENSSPYPPTFSFKIHFNTNFLLGLTGYPSILHVISFDQVFQCEIYKLFLWDPLEVFS